MKETRKDKHPEPHHDEFDMVFEKQSADGYFIANEPNGSWFYVDPFVGCAWEYEKASELIGKKARVKGFWSLSCKNGMPVFLIDENGITFN